MAARKAKRSISMILRKIEDCEQSISSVKKIRFTSNFQYYLQNIYLQQMYALNVVADSFLLTDQVKKSIYY